MQARALGVTKDWLRLIAAGSLDDIEFLEAIRTAAEVTELWEMVNPSAREVLALPVAKAAALGFENPRDVVLDALIDASQVRGTDPLPRGTRQSGDALKQITSELDRALHDRSEASLDRDGRLWRAPATRREYTDAVALRYFKEEQSRGPGVKPADIHAKIAHRDGMSQRNVRRLIARGRLQIVRQA